jgi:hypothetical protein
MKKEKQKINIIPQKQDLETEPPLFSTLTSGGRGQLYVFCFLLKPPIRV